MRLMTRARLVTLGIGLVIGPFGIAAEPTGRAIADEVDRRSRSETQSYLGRLEVINEKGAIAAKSWRVWRDGWGANAKSLLTFNQPAEVAGVTLLTHGRKNEPDQQWMYTPSIDKTRRIAPQERKTRFLGTHFSYEDMEFRDVDDREYQLEAEELRDGLECWRLLATPKSAEKSQYSEIRYWVRKDLMVFHEAHYFAGGLRRRVLKLLDYRLIDSIPTPMTWEMTDSEKPGLTRLHVEGIVYNRQIDPNWFVPGFKPANP